jgi:hypothetical protein
VAYYTVFTLASQVMSTDALCDGNEAPITMHNHAFAGPELTGRTIHKPVMERTAMVQSVVVALNLSRWSRDPRPTCPENPLTFAPRA